MSHERICGWLGLPIGVWPPDHYQLLDVAPDQVDPAHLEAKVFQRLESVRHYQLQDPDQATEAMNRLAQAFVCLTNPETRKAYDEQLFGKPARARPKGVTSAQTATALEDAPITNSQDPLAWLYAPGAIESNLATAEETGAEAATTPPTLSSGNEAVLENLDQALQALAESSSVSPLIFPEAAPERLDPIEEAARSSDLARRGLVTKRALYHRIAGTRRLLQAWDEAGEYLGQPGRRLAKPTEATELIYWLGTIRAQLRDFPPLIGVAGQPGYLVKALAKQQAVVPTFQTLLPSQRVTLARDWDAGRKLLLAHRDYLRQELRALRRRSLLGRLMRVIGHVVSTYPGWILLVLGILALMLALGRAAYLDA